MTNHRLNWSGKGLFLQRGFAVGLISIVVILASTPVKAIGPSSKVQVSETTSTPIPPSSQGEPNASAATLKCPSLEWVEKAKLPSVALAKISIEEKDGKYSKQRCVVTSGVLDSRVDSNSAENKVSSKSIYNVASLAKPTMTLLVMALVEKNLLDLHEPLHHYWVDPDIAQDERHQKLTPFLVLTHQTGFHNWRYQAEDKALSFQFSPGSGFNYSGEGFEYLQKALVAKMGQSYEDLVQQYVFKPAGMNSSTLIWKNVRDKSQYAYPHDSKGEWLDVEHLPQASAADNLYTTIDDYASFVEYVLTWKTRQPALFELMISNYMADSNYEGFSEKRGFGLGWELLLNVENKERVLIHTGGDKGVSAITMVYPDSNNAFVMFLNSDAPGLAYQTLIPQMHLGQAIWNSQ